MEGEELDEERLDVENFYLWEKMKGSKEREKARIVWRLWYFYFLFCGDFLAINIWILLTTLTLNW